MDEFDEKKGETPKLLGIGEKELTSHREKSPYWRERWTPTGREKG